MQWYRGIQSAAPQSSHLVMGCAASTPAAEAELVQAPQPVPAPTAQTFGRDPTLRKEDFIVKGQADAEIVRLPGDVKGQQFSIADCSNCTIALFDHSEQILVDRCTDCNIIISACCTSVSLRALRSCTVSVCAAQLRFRECADVTVLGAVHTRPVIESSSDLRLGCWRLAYTPHAQHLQAAILEPWANKIFQVHDFDMGPSGGSGLGVHWTGLTAAEEVAAAGRQVAALPAPAVDAVGLRVVHGWSDALRVPDQPASSDSPVPAAYPTPMPEAGGEAEPATESGETTKTEEEPRLPPASTPATAVPPQAPPADAPVLMLVLLPGSDWRKAAWRVCEELCAAADGAALSLVRARPHTLTPAQAADVGGGAGASLALALHWAGADGEVGGLLARCGAALTAAGVAEEQAVVVTGQAAAALATKWFVEWESDFNK